MKILNRYALIVRPKQPFVDWVNFACADDHKVTLEDVRDEPDVFLWPEIEDPKEQEEYLKEKCQTLFKHFLTGWCTDEDTHPKDLSWKHFKEWFEWEVLSMVFDTLPASIRREEYDR